MTGGHWNRLATFEDWIITLKTCRTLCVELVHEATIIN